MLPLTANWLKYEPLAVKAVTPLRPSSRFNGERETSLAQTIHVPFLFLFSFNISGTKPPPPPGTDIPPPPNTNQPPSGTLYMAIFNDSYSM